MMRPWTRIQAFPASAMHWIVSVPIFFKVLGIGALVAVIFGSVMLYFMETETKAIHTRVLIRRASTTCASLAGRLKDPVLTGDLFLIRQEVDETLEITPDLRYVIIRDFQGNLLTHTFEKGVPPGLLQTYVRPTTERSHVQVLDTGPGLVYDVTMPISKGNAGTLEIGFSDSSLVRETTARVRLVLGALGISAAACIFCTLLLTHLVTRPLDHLRRIAERIGAGDFKARATIFSDDEIGGLALTMNRLAQRIEDYRREVERKEAARESLIAGIVQAQEDERKRIALELHDQLGQSLSTVLLTFQGARNKCGCCDSKCLDLEKEIRGLIDETRRLAWDIRPPLLDDFGIDSALQRYTADLSARLGYPIEYECFFPAELGRLPARLEITLYRIVQEALTNVIRHSKATRVSVLLSCHASHVTLVVEDNGCGFDPASVRQESLGLAGMRERAALVGGDLEIESRLGEGTELLITLPLEEPAHADQNHPG